MRGIIGNGQDQQGIMMKNMKTVCNILSVIFHSQSGPSLGIATLPSHRSTCCLSSLTRNGFDGKHSHVRCLYTTPNVSKGERLSTLDIIKTRINAAGPLTVSEFMTAVLTNPNTGYYMKKDVFGKQGDFITSPEISQMFGELLAVWIVHEWSQLGSPTPFQLVELGPGRGTLADDILRVIHRLKLLPKEDLSLHLVEISPKMSELQADKLTSGATGPDEDMNVNGQPHQQDRGSPYRSACSKTGVPVHWYDTLSKVPRGCSCFIAHEFLDALPIHKFQRTPSGWREVLVNIDESDGPDELCFVLSAAATPATTVLIREDEKRDHLEVSPQSGVVVQELADRINTDGGMSLVIDYGHSGEKEDTLRAFKEHKLHNVLKEPGTADVTADVDFSYLQKTAGNLVSSFGPVPQGQFLQMMGIQTRLAMLLRQADHKQQTDLVSGFKMLVDPSQMGERFKMWAMFPHRKDNYRPAGFPP
ncbi:protein arginine methyltransferase NDUFAF7, mitochondrial-like isoform X2 [Apostichopus japonicus]|uniref:protein arginine methyltransferase NDUFAF7, mitochondrial-like isoform X2 n=1 Tax=Stichopus japonicus TaxID=307972 RepID=UPI003AB45173